MILPGILSSQISGHLSTTAYESIATVTVGSGGSSTISFTAIPTTYSHLQLRGSIQTNRGTYGRDEVKFQVGNGSVDTSANYSFHYIAGDGSSAYAGNGTSTSYGWIDGVGDSTSGVFGAVVLDILDYANTNKYKTMRVLSGSDYNGVISGLGDVIYLGSASWRSTSAITAITFLPVDGTAFTQYSTFALYGVK